MENKTDLIETNNAKIDSIENKCISKRLKRELSIMYKLYEEIYVVIENENQCTVIIYEFLNEKRISYKFIITKHYPFICPTVFLNNKMYIEFLISNQNQHFDDFKKIAGIDCLCCESITSLCKDKWSCRNTLQDIIVEMNHFKNIKRNIVLKLLLDKIKYKYLITDINLGCWVFN